MNKILIPIIALLYVSCSSTQVDKKFVGIKEKKLERDNRKIASLLDSDDIMISQNFSNSSKDQAVVGSQKNCIDTGGTLIRTLVWEPGESLENYWQAITICQREKQAHSKKNK